MFLLVVSYLCYVLVQYIQTLLQEQFPLIQRQWETVSHFRTQIIHRATLSLRAVEKPYQVRIPLEAEHIFLKHFPGDLCNTPDPSYTRVTAPDRYPDHLPFPTYENIEHSPY